MPAHQYLLEGRGSYVPGSAAIPPLSVHMTLICYSLCFSRYTDSNALIMIIIFGAVVLFAMSMPGLCLTM